MGGLLQVIRVRYLRILEDQKKALLSGPTYISGHLNGCFLAYVYFPPSILLLVILHTLFILNGSGGPHWAH